MEQLTLTARALRLRRKADGDVVARTLEGDSAAFFELHRRYRKRIEGACVKRLGDPAIAEDAVQETFMRVLRAAPQSIENTEAWLLTIARNVCIDITRRASRVEVATSDDSADFAVGLPATDSATEIIRRENARQVFLALRRMPTRYRTALTLREFHGMSSVEIAEAMGTTPNAVDSMVSRSRDAFGAAYAEVSGFPNNCRVNVERIYRDLGTGIDTGEQEQLQAHIAQCPRCRAEHARSRNTRYSRGLMPLLALKIPGIDLFSDALTRATVAPGVMHSFPAVTATATAVVTLGAALAISPWGANLVMPSRTDLPELKAVMPASSTQLGLSELDPATQAVESPSAFAVAVDEDEASATVLPVAIATTKATSGTGTTPASGSTDSGAGSGGNETASSKPPASDDSDPDESEKDSDKPAADPKPEPKPEPEPEPEPVDDPTGGWGEAPEDAVIVDLEPVAGEGE